MNQKWYLQPWTALRAKASTVKCFTKLSHQHPLIPSLFGCRQPGCCRTDLLLQSRQHLQSQAPLSSYRPGQHREEKKYQSTIVQLRPSILHHPVVLLSLRQHEKAKEQAKHRYFHHYLLHRIAIFWRPFAASKVVSPPQVCHSLKSTLGSS